MVGRGEQVRVRGWHDVVVLSVENEDWSGVAFDGREVVEGVENHELG